MHDRRLLAVQVLHGAAGLVKDLEHETHVERRGRRHAGRDQDGARRGGRRGGLVGGGRGRRAPRPASPDVRAAAWGDTPTQVLEHVDQAAARAELHYDQELSACAPPATLVRRSKKLNEVWMARDFALHTSIKTEILVINK